MKYEWLVFIKQRTKVLGFEFSSRKKAKDFFEEMNGLGAECIMSLSPIITKPKRKRKK